MKLVPAADAGPAALEGAEAIYAGAFPDELRAPFADLLRDQTLVLVTEGATAGLAVVRDLADTGWTFLRYFAIGTRGHGLGSRAWPLLLGHCAGRGRRWLALDVEDPDEPGSDPAERDLRVRRIAFYQRLGVTLLPIQEYQPPHDGHPHPMRLLAAATTAADHAPATPAEVRACLLAVYEHRYGLTATDPVVRRTLTASGLPSRAE